MVFNLRGAIMFFFLYLQRLGCLKNKLNEIRYELERILISKKSKRLALSQSRHSRAGLSIWASRHLGSAYWHLPCADWNSKSVDKPSWVPSPRSSFGSIWTPFLRIFYPKIAPQCILICILKINPFFFIFKSLK